MVKKINLLGINSLFKIINLVLHKISFLKNYYIQMSYEFTIIIPVFNEEDNLNRVEISLSKYLKIASKKNKRIIY